MLTNLHLALVKNPNIFFMEGKSATLVEFSMQMLSCAQLFLAALETLQSSVLLCESPVSLVSGIRLELGEGWGLRLSLISKF